MSNCYHLLNDEFKRSFFLVIFGCMIWVHTGKVEFCTNFVILLIRKDIEKEKNIGKKSGG